MTNFDNFTTVYLSEFFEPSDNEVLMLEKCIERDIAVGDGFVNIYTKDVKIIEAFVDLVGDHNVLEIA